MFVHRNSFSKNAEADVSVSNDGQKHFDNKYLNAFEEQHRVKCEATSAKKITLYQIKWNWKKMFSKTDKLTTQKEMALLADQ